MMVGMDLVWDVVIQCVGLLWVQDIYELFLVVEIFSYMCLLCGDWLMIISNGVAFVVLVLDVLWLCNGKLVMLSEEICQKLCDVLLEYVVIFNLFDLCDDVSSEYYIKMLDILFYSQDFDVLMVIYLFSVVVFVIESV